jgi:hypothetical protein
VDSNLTNIEEYFELVKGEYDISFEEFKLACLSPFAFTKKVMSLGLLKDIRLQYFGVFKVSSGRVKYSKKAVTENFENGLISEERYNKRMNILNNFKDE